MRNHSRLYILRPDGEMGEWQLIATSNGVFPLLWKLLLAHGEIAQADVLRVLAGTAHQVMASPARLGLERYERFIAFLRRDPRVNALPAVRRYLAGAAQHLGELIAEWSEPEADAPLLCGALEEAPRPAPMTRSEFLQQLNGYREEWQQLDYAMQRSDTRVVEAILCPAGSNLRLTDWRTWAGAFGLASFEHEYFSTAFRRPRDEEYADHGYDELGDADQLSVDLVRFREHGRWGVRRGDVTVLHAAWDRVLRAGDEGLVWIRSGGVFGLASIAGENAGRVLIPPQFASISPFEGDLAVVRVNGKAGYLRLDGAWHVVPQWDEAWPYRHGFAVVVRDDRLGYIDAHGALIAPAEFDEADHFTAAGVARVRKGLNWGLLRNDGRWAVDPECDALEWSSTLQGWLCNRHGLSTLMHADGTPWIDAGCESIEAIVPHKLIRIVRESRSGLLHWSGETAVACEYDELSLAYRSPPAFIAHRGDRVGVIDGRGRIVAPFEFSCVEAIETVPHADAREQLLRVYSIPARGRPRAGIWDATLQQYRVACEHDYLWRLALDDAGNFGYVAASAPFHDRGSRQLRVGILDADGRWLVVPDYAWIGDKSAPATAAAAKRICDEIHEAWRNGHPVMAERCDGSRVRLPPPTRLVA